MRTFGGHYSEAEMGEGEGREAKFNLVKLQEGDRYSPCIVEFTNSKRIFTIPS